MRRLPSLTESFRFAIPEGSGVTSLLLLEEDTLCVVGTSTGCLLCVADPKGPPPKPGRAKAEELTLQYD